MQSFAKPDSLKLPKASMAVTVFENINYLCCVCSKLQKLIKKIKSMFELLNDNQDVFLFTR